MGRQLQQWQVSVQEMTAIHLWKKYIYWNMFPVANVIVIVLQRPSIGHKFEFI